MSYSPKKKKSSLSKLFTTPVLLRLLQRGLQRTDTSPAPAMETMSTSAHCPQAFPLPPGPPPLGHTDLFLFFTHSGLIGLQGPWPPCPMQSPAHRPCSQLHPKARSEASSFCLWPSCHRGAHAAALELEFFLFCCCFEVCLPLRHHPEHKPLECRDLICFCLHAGTPAQCQPRAPARSRPWLLKGLHAPRDETAMGARPWHARCPVWHS